MTRLSAPQLAVVTAAPVLAPRGYYISVAEREVVCTGQISGDPLQDGTTLAYHGFFSLALPATPSDVKDGMSIDFGTTAGARDIGTSRIRKSPVTTVWYIAETPPALLPIADGHYFTVYREIQPRLRLPIGVEVVLGGASYVNSISMRRDYDQDYVAQNVNFTPKANITRSATLRQAPRPADFVDGFHTATPEIYRTVVLSSAFSFTLTTGGSIASRLWDVRDGTITVGTSSSTTITVQFPVGYRLISLTVTASDGKVGVMYFPIWVHDANNMPLSNFQVTRDTHGEWSEVEADFFQQDTSETVIPKGVPLCFWEDDPFWGETIPEQYIDQVLGWCKEDTTLFRKYQARNTLLLTGLGEWLNRFRSIPQRIYNAGVTPRVWFEMQAITLDRLVFFMMENFCTGNLIGNLFLSDVTDELKSLDVTGESLFGQIKYIVQGYYGRARFDALNGLWLRRHRSYLTSAERAAIDAVIDLTSAHWLDGSAPKIQRRQYTVVASLLGAGASWDGATNTIYNARAPGRTPSESNTEQDAPGQNLPATGGQAKLNQLTGAHYAVLNNVRDSVPLDLLHNLDVIEPAWGEPITITSSDSDSGLALAADEFLVKEVSVTYDDPYSGRGKRVSWTLEGVVTGVDAQMVEVPVDETDPTDYEPPIDIDPAPTEPVVVPPYDGTDLMPTDLILFDSGDSQCSIATGIDFSGAVPSLTYTDASTGLGGFNAWATGDAYNWDRYLANQYPDGVGAGDGIYRNDDPFGGSSWSRLIDYATLLGDSSRRAGQILTSINRNGYFCLAAQHHGFFYTTDGGSNWNTVSILGGAIDWAHAWAGFHNHLAISPYNNGAQGWIYAHVAWGDDSTHGVYKSTDWGATWTLIFAGALNNAKNISSAIDIPYIRIDGTTANINDANQELYISTTYGTFFSDDAGLSWAVLFDGIGDGAVIGWNLKSFTYDGDRMLLARAAGFGGAEDHVVFAPTANTLVGGTVSSPNVDTHVLNVTNQYANYVNGYSTDKRAALAWSPYANYSPTRFVFTVDEGVTWTSVEAPASYTGIGYMQWSLNRRRLP